ncbi:hypothetical protein HZA38_06470 [Candidatus Peregrinibacteria bacterium]|nr:hypothetical protein [Candidatus Peregrinibacteria bacterium]
MREGNEYSELMGELLKIATSEQRKVVVAEEGVSQESFQATFRGEDGQERKGGGRKAADIGALLGAMLLDILEKESEEDPQLLQIRNALRSVSEGTLGMVVSRIPQYFMYPAPLSLDSDGREHYGAHPVRILHFGEPRNLASTAAPGELDREQKEFAERINRWLIDGSTSDLPRVTTKSIQYEEAEKTAA